MSPSQAKTLPDMWLDPEDDPRKGGPEIVDERTNVLDYLRAYRLTLRLKCDGLDAEQMARRSVPPSTLSLLGLVRHMAKVEQSWFRIRAAGQPVPKMYVSDQDPDGDFDGAVGTDECVAEAFAAWEREVAFTDELVAGQPDMGAVYDMGHHGSVSLRELLVHMVEEYARHCGHADLLRECIDGRTGQ